MVNVEKDIYTAMVDDPDHWALNGCALRTTARCLSRQDTPG